MFQCLQSRCFTVLSALCNCKIFSSVYKQTFCFFQTVFKTYHVMEPGFPDSFCIKISVHNGNSILKNGYYIIDDFFHESQDSLPELFLIPCVEKQLKKAAVYDILLMVISENNETAK